MTQLEKIEPCRCGHARRAHCGKDCLDDCSGIDVTQKNGFCQCKRFRPQEAEAQIQQQEGEMPKKATANTRVQRLYKFDVERARTLRDEKYKGKENLIAFVLRGLIEMNKDAVTFEQMAEAATKAGAKGKMTRARFPLNKLRSTKVLKSTKETSTPKAAPKPKAVRKARKAFPKANGSSLNALGGEPQPEAAQQATE